MSRRCGKLRPVCACVERSSCSRWRSGKGEVTESFLKERMKKKEAPLVIRSNHQTPLLKKRRKASYGSKVWLVKEELRMCPIKVRGSERVQGSRGFTVLLATYSHSSLLRCSDVASLYRSLPILIGSRAKLILRQKYPS